MEKGFADFLKRGGRSAQAKKRIIRHVEVFKAFVQEHQGKSLDQVGSEDLDLFVSWIESKQKSSAKGPLWALIYYFKFAGNKEMERLASLLREQRIRRRPFPLRKFHGVDSGWLNRLSAIGIENVEQMLAAGNSEEGRAKLADESGVPAAVILELVKLSDLARIPGIKGIRARLYHDAGVDTVEKMAAWEPDALLARVTDFVAQSAFTGIAPLPAEVIYSVAKAKGMSKIVKY